VGAGFDSSPGLAYHSRILCHHSADVSWSYTLHSGVLLRRATCLAVTTLACILPLGFSLFLPSLILLQPVSSCVSHLVSVAIESRHAVHNHEQLSQSQPSPRPRPCQQTTSQTSVCSCGHELSPGLDGSKVVFAKR